MIAGTKYQWCSVHLFGRIIGFTILPREQHVKVHAKKLAKLLGFKSLQQYINAYPGQFKAGSSAIEVGVDKRNIHYIYVEDKQIPNPNMFFNAYLSVYIETNDINEHVEYRVKWACFNYDCGIFGPTMKEAQKMYGRKSIPKKEIWLCEDWVEPKE